MIRISRVYLIFFKLTGLAPFSFSKASTKMKMKVPTFSYSYAGLLYNILLILIFLSSSFILLPNLPTNEPEGKSNKLIEKIDIVLAACGTICILGILLNYCVKQLEMVSIGNDIILLDDTLKRFCNVYETNDKHLNIHLLILVHLLISLLLLINHFFISDSIEGTLFVNLIDIIISFYINQYAFILNIIKIKFRNMRNVLKLITLTINKCETFSITKLNDRKVLTYVNSIRRAHDLLIRICNRISGFNTFTILIAINYASVLIIYYTYSFISHLSSFVSVNKDNVEIFLFMDVFLSVVTMIFAIINLSVNGNMVADESENMSRDIIELLDTNERLSPGNQLELEDFLFEFLHRKVSFDAWDIITIDLSLLKSITGTTLTYLILLFQNK